MIKSIIICTLMILAVESSAQIGTGISDNFDDNSLAGGWSGNSSYILTETNQELNVNASVANGSWSVFSFNFPTMDVTAYPYVKLRMKSSSSVNVRVDFQDQTGYVTNASPVIKAVSSSSYTEFTFDFSGKFAQNVPSNQTVDPSAITSILFFFSPGGAFTGTVHIDYLQIGSDTGIEPPQDAIRINQIGFYPEGPKMAIAVGAAAGSFYVVSSDKQDTLYTGTLSAADTWSASGETVRKADFTDFETAGTYYVLVPGLGYSHQFDIKEEVHHDVAKALMKGFYFQRASIALTSPYAGLWARAKGHPDNVVYVHNSAASPLRPTGTTISCPGGWYDAGDYNKYVVNSGISTYTVLRLYEEFPDYFDTLSLNIPENSNALPDLLDEALWNVRWLLTMQDPYDGGVYHKLTNALFGGTIMPASATDTRYVVQKSTGAALNFAAVMAQSARIFSKYNMELPGLADSCINAAVNAWNWARKNPSVIYDQTTLANPAIKTGEYKDTNFSDEFGWAGFELYATTNLDSFYTIAGTVSYLTIPGWASVRPLGYYTLAHHRKNLTVICDTQTVKNRVINLAATFRNEALNNSAFGVGISDGYFYWGSSGIAANQGLIAILAFNMTKDSTYYKTAIAQLDYLLGRNGANYSFVTGYGDVTPKDIHHRISGADGIEDPVPGLLAGGPNIDDQSDCDPTSYPTSTYKAKAYLDAFCSYSTNEIAINWNAPAAFLAGALEALQDGAVARAESYNPVLPTSILGIKKSEQEFGKLKLYPNPASSELIVEISNAKKGKIQISDVTGKIVKTVSGTIHTSNTFSIEELPKGIYTLIISDDSSVSVEKFVKE